MAQQVVERRDVDFILHELFQIGDLGRHREFADYNKKTMDMVISEARNIAIREILPTNKPADEEGCGLENGRVTVPETYHKVWNILREGGWVAMSDDPEWGGQGMPKVLATAASEFLNGANSSLYIFLTLTHGAAKLLESFGTEEQKKLCLKKMFSGEWAGTMLLTEPNAGSDVGALETTARRNSDGTFSITGNKIFISSGDHEVTTNIIHPVLARIEGAPTGTRGISLFLVPKYRINPDGGIGEFNDVVCTGIEHKMGLHGNPTCALALGSKGNCIGTLLGEENKGMRAMFQMMNEARLYVGLQALSLASSSYLNAVNYARERIQGPPLGGKEAASVPIIRHPDVRRQLMNMKVGVEGLRCIIYYVSYLFDLQKVARDDAERETIQGLIDLLIPVAKGYLSDRAFDICSHGVQIYGGYGFVEEYPQSQNLRDCRITMIYEGTNGIQGMDLLGRKLGMNGGKPFRNLMDTIRKTIGEARAIPETTALAEGVDKAVTRLGETALCMGRRAASNDMPNAFAFAHPFLEVLGDVVVAWMLLWRAVVAAPKVKNGGKDKAFYQGQVKSAEFFIQALLPATLGKMTAIEAGCPAAVEIPEEAFIG